MATMVRPKPGGVFTLPFFYAFPYRKAAHRCTPLGIGSVLFIRLTGIGSNKARLDILGRGNKVSRRYTPYRRLTGYQRLTGDRAYPCDSPEKKE
jgi:hypothetical protein